MRAEPEPHQPLPIYAEVAPEGALLKRTPLKHKGNELATMLALALLYYLVARSSLLLAFAHSNATPVWPPSGIAFGAVLLLGYRVCPAIALGAFTVNLAVFHANGLPISAGVVVTSGLITLGNTLEAATGAWLMRRYANSDGGQPLSQLQNVYKFTLVAVFMCMLSAGIGSTTLVLNGLIPATAWPTVIITWWVGDTTGVLLVGSALIAWGRPWLAGMGGNLQHDGAIDPLPTAAPMRSVGSIIQAVVALLLLLLLTAAIFGRPYDAGDGQGWLPYLLVLCLAWASYRYGLRGATLACLVLSGGAVLGTVKDLGPFAIGPLNDALISLESFVALCSVLSMVLCADVSERVHMRGSASRGLIAQWSTLLIGISLTVLVWHLVEVDTERRAKEHFDNECADIQQQLGRLMTLYETGLRSGQALFATEATVSQAQWHDFVSGMELARNFPGMLGLGYASYVIPTERAAMEKSMRAEGLTGFHIWSNEPVRSAGLVAPAVPVQYLEPFTGVNLHASGYDMLSEPVRRAALLYAAQSGLPVMTDKVALVQDTATADHAGQLGFLIYLPVYRKDAPLATVAQRMAALKGYTYSPIRAVDLMRNLRGAADAEVQLEIFDGNSTADAARIYSSGARSASDAMQYPNPYRRVLSQTMVNHQWTLRVTSLPLFEDAIDRQKAHIVLLAGTIISLLFFGVVRALSARHAYAKTLAEEMTRALRASESLLIVARDQAEAASRSKSEFVANMSHEIRTPLNAVLGMAHLLGNTTLSDDQQKYLEMIRLSGISLLHVLNDVLDFSKIEAGRMELAPMPFQLGTVLESIATIMTVNSGDKDLELALGVEPDVPQSLVGDGHRLQQILINLTGNAIKFTEKGQVSVLVERIAGVIEPVGNVTLRFTVRDSGIGMEANRIAQLFAPFSQADASTTRRFGGTGLGLSISRNIATLMRGAIEVRSTVGMGSEFTLTVPLSIDANVRDNAGFCDDEPLSLLLVDADPISANYLRKTITGRGWQIDYADSDSAAKKLMEHAKNHYDAVLVNWNISGMDSLKTMQALRAVRPATHPAMVLVVSAHGQGKLLQTEGVQAADAVLLKPVTSARLANAVQHGIKHRGKYAVDGAHTSVHGLPPASDHTPPGGDAIRLLGVRLLLVEDNPVNQLVARSMLVHAGANVDAVNNGKAALDLLRTDAHLYDLILMDVQMPEMDGFEATSLIRSELGLALPILAMTAGVMLSEREQCIACGMDDFIGKPIDVEQMLGAIARNLPTRLRTARQVGHRLSDPPHGP